MKQVATKLQFQLKKEDRQALVDRTNQEITEQLQYEREMSDLNERYIEEVKLMEKGAMHDINLTKIQFKKLQMEYRREYEAITQRENMRSD